MMGNKDYYKTLGVDPSASQEDIKKAYRDLAKVWHPDVNADSDDANDIFKDIGEAYATLSNPQKRQEYDKQIRRNMGGFPNDFFEGFGFNVNAGSVNFANLINDIFSGGNRGEARNSSVRVEVLLTPIDILDGTKKEISFTKFSGCSVCNGSGLKNDVCSACGGTGSKSQPGEMRVVCPDCRGAGRTSGGEACEECGGKAFISESVSMEVDIPPGINIKPVIINDGGNRENPSAPPGHIIIVPRIQLPTNVNVIGDKMMMVTPIDPVQFIIGGSETVETPFGEMVEIDIPEGTPFGHIHAEPGMGMPKTFGARDPRDVMLFKLLPAIPQQITEEQKGILSEYLKARENEGVIPPN